MGISRRLHSFVFDQKCIPWSVSQRVEAWVETGVRDAFPALYRRIRLGRWEDLLRPVTRGPKHHFFGYYGKCPWNASGRFLLAHEVAFNDRAPESDDHAAIGLIDLADDCRFHPLASTAAWNWQQGAMAQWHPADPETLLIHNERREGRFIGVVRDKTGQERQVFDHALYAVSPDGRQGFSLNFARLHVHRPGYGYAGVADPWAADLQPEMDGVTQVDLASGASRLVVSLSQLAGVSPRPEMQGVHHWVNHIQVSPRGSRLAFFHLWRRGERNWGVRLYTCRLDGSALSCALDTSPISHYDWLDEDRLLVWANVNGRGAFVLCDVTNGQQTVFGADVLREDGHASFSPDRRWVINDTYPDRFGLRNLMLLRWDDARRTELARLYSPKARWWGEIRCDLHPRWSRDGKQVCIDSVHSGERQVYVLDIARLLR